ncbi:hypothetical protein [Micromonospora sp. NBC_01796]|uniref:hypothetical protein n=1 Tax=Micromonospora sp. NBC_01796 TaxID=2975987 RepID=UPI002DDB242D|nr:hypothetical protein [Micromonospora sp. NBC_01796]WSA87860.1 outer membrane lipoprotein-sorting protein [Micromonospora sp. NBC_01796]
MTALNEDQLGQQLGTRLHDEMAGLGAPSGLTATLHRRHNRRTWGLRVAGGVPVVAAIALAASLTLSPAGTSPNTNASGTGNTGSIVDNAPDMLTVSFVSERTTSALGNLTDSVQHARSEFKDGKGRTTLTNERWVDAKTGRERTDEQDVQTKGTITVVKSGNGNDAIVIDHQRKKWWNDQIAAMPQGVEVTVTQGPNGERIETPTGKKAVGPLMDPAELKDALATGTLKLVGEETLDGKATVHLQWVPVPSSTTDIWVDAESYLPVRKVSAGPKAIDTVDFEWLPRTPENLAKLEGAAPADYKKLPCAPLPVEGKDCGLGN